MSDTFNMKNVLRQGHDLSPLLFKFVLDCVIRRAQVKLGGWKLNGTHQLLVYADDDNILGGNVPTIKENAEALIVASKETGLEVNADKSRYNDHVSRTEYRRKSRYEV